MKINVNGINIYYDVYGEGQPLILLHGNNESHNIFDKLITNLSQKFKIYAIDSKCHGQSDNPLDITYDLMAQYIIEFINILGITKPILYGFSDGGIVGLLIAIKEPDILSKLIISGANINPSGIIKWVIILSKLIYFVTRNKLIRLTINEPNILPEELQKIQIPTYVLTGEKDLIKLEHTKFIAVNIPKSVLKILPKENHSSYIVHSSKLVNIFKDLEIL